MDNKEQIRLRINNEEYLEDNIFIKLLKVLIEYFDIAQLNGLLILSDNKHRIVTFDKIYGNSDKRFGNEIVKIV